MENTIDQTVKEKQTTKCIMNHVRDCCMYTKNTSMAVYFRTEVWYILVVNINVITDGTYVYVQLH